MVWRRRPRSARIVQNPAKADPRCLQGDLRSMYVHERRHSHQPGSRFPGCHHFPVCAAGTSIGPYLTIGCSASAQVVLTVPTVSQRTFRERLHPTTSWARERAAASTPQYRATGHRCGHRLCVCSSLARVLQRRRSRFAALRKGRYHARKHAREHACAYMGTLCGPLRHRDAYRVSAIGRGYTSSSTYCTCPCAK